LKDADEENYLEGPAIMLDILAIYRQATRLAGVLMNVDRR
jgi:hypothetical protein